MGDSDTKDTKKGERVALQRDNTFKIRHLGITLKFKFDADTRSVELLSDEDNPPTGLAADAVVPVVDSSNFDELLRRLSRSDSVYVSTVISDMKELEEWLVPLGNFSKDVTSHYGFKPKVVLRVAGEVDAAASDVNDLMRSAAADYDLDAYIVSTPDFMKKS